MKKQWTEQELRGLCDKLMDIIGADITYEEETALYDAVSIISPEYYEEILPDPDEEFLKEFDALMKLTPEEREKEMEKIDRELGIEPRPKGVIDLKRQAVISDMGRYSRGEITIEEFEERWGYRRK